ncbi:MAG: ADP-ribosylglycohydrolase family protein [Verrucomicrobiaceae bacterium]|nr:ADP-ribosylglycohydrolase family protein [Verrucomicrobiaceae bacterium]
MSPETVASALHKDPRIAGLLLGAFVGDALALGPHWVYDPSTIQAKLGTVSGFNDPLTPYHPGKKAGDYTHIGDQMWLLQQSISDSRWQFEVTHYFKRWKAFWDDEKTISYRDKATKETLHNITKGLPMMEAGALSDELAGPARGMPVLAAGLIHGQSVEAMIESIQEQTALTHRSADALHAAAFLARLIQGLVTGLDLPKAIAKALGASAQVVKDLGVKATSPNLASVDTTTAISTLGQSCDMEEALPACLLLLSRHGHDYKEAMVQNVMAGGDSATRGIVVGGVLGYYHGQSAVPEAWRKALTTPPF